MNTSTMSIVLKNFTENFYLKNGTSWTTDITAARRFDSVDRANGFCATNQLSDFQAVPFFAKKRQAGIVA